jgi:hypothetical protein
MVASSGPERTRRPHFPITLSWGRWTLQELIVLIAVAALSSYLASIGAAALAACVTATAVAARTAAVDFSPVGGVACGLTMLFGVPMLFLALLFAAS